MTLAEKFDLLPTEARHEALDALFEACRWRGHTLPLVPGIPSVAQAKAALAVRVLVDAMAAHGHEIEELT